MGAKCRGNQENMISLTKTCFSCFFVFYFDFCKLKEKMSISKNTRQRSYFGPPRGGPRGAHRPDTNTIFENVTFRISFQKNARFTNPKTAPFIWPDKRQSQRRQKSRYQYDFYTFLLTQLFSKKGHFHKPEDSPVRLACPAIFVKLRPHLSRPESMAEACFVTFFFHAQSRYRREKRAQTWFCVIFWIHATDKHAWCIFSVFCSFWRLRFHFF